MHKRAWEFFGMLNPVHHGSTREAIERYKVEPYVMCADIYGVAPHTGRGGWTWYTGAAGWMYRLTVETLLGLQLEVDHLRIAPCAEPVGFLQNPLPLSQYRLSHYSQARR